MAAVWMRLRSELRRRWRPLLVVAVLAGVSGGVVLTTAIAADRTGTVTPFAFAAVGGASLLVALANAAIPARSAARTKPALVLRAE